MNDTLREDNLNDAHLIEPLLHSVVERQASDVHLVPGNPVTYRVHGLLEQEGEPLDPADIKRMVESFLPDRLIARMHDGKDFDCSVAIRHDDVSYRFRANVFLSLGQWCACLRHVPDAIPSFEWMGFSRELAERLISYRNGLVIVTGVTGTGKSTTLAALVHLLNQRGATRVITVEEPIEYVHKPITTSVVTQREVGRDVDSFYDGLKFGLRQDPDVMLVGEIRDRDTAQMALSAAETGHLILTTMHTKDAKGAVTRFVDLFPHKVQEDVRVQLSLSLRSVVSQHLLPSANVGEKRALAIEALHVNDPVRIAIRFGKIESIESAIQTGKRDGMTSLDDDLRRLTISGSIDIETARRFAKDPDQLMG